VLPAAVGSGRWPMSMCLAPSWSALSTTCFIENVVRLPPHRLARRPSSGGGVRSGARASTRRRP
jgi:hypothetical protein